MGVRAWLTRLVAERPPVDSGPWWDRDRDKPMDIADVQCPLRSLSTGRRCAYYRGHPWRHDQPFPQT